MFKPGLKQVRNFSDNRKGKMVTKEDLNQATQEAADNKEAKKSMGRNTSFQESEIQSIESEREHNIAENAERQRLHNLIEWVNKRDVDTSKVDIRQYGPNYRGLHAAQDIESGDEIFVIGREYMITIDDVLDTPTSKQMVENETIISNPQDLTYAFTAYIIEKRRLSMDRSKFGAFIDSWPKSCGENPVFFSDEELEYLKGSPFLEVILHQ